MPRYEAFDDPSPDPDHYADLVRSWQQEHEAFITAYNATIEAEGLPLEVWQGF